MVAHFELFYPASNGNDLAGEFMANDVPCLGHRLVSSVNFATYQPLKRKGHERGTPDRTYHGDRCHIILRVSGEKHKGE
jgi:hypothetical protein